jgi:hypothetical protein
MADTAGPTLDYTARNPFDLIKDLTMLRFHQSQLKQHLTSYQLTALGHAGKRDGLGCERKNPLWLWWSPG